MSAKYAASDEGKVFPMNSAAARWRLEVLSDTVGPSMTRAEFQQECDINFILKGYENGKAWPGNMPGVEPLYYDFTTVPSTLQEAMSQMQEAAAAFGSLHANVRREFDNDPVRFVEFAADPANLDQMRQWGLAPAAKPPIAPEPGPGQQLAPAPGAPAAPPQPGAGPSSG